MYIFLNYGTCSHDNVLFLELNKFSIKDVIYCSHKYKHESINFKLCVVCKTT